ncbi:MAG: glycosyltransferase family 1 protein [Flavobacteriaceae bacterium]|nr:glycosyltransferase family 1 protein [Flavobacteriaceae bacterium]
MKIAFDAKRFFHNSSGLGNYSRDFVRILAHYYPENHYLLLAKRQSQRGRDILSHPSVEFLPLSGGLFPRQLKMGTDAQRAGADLFHGLSGELPLRWGSPKIKKIVTIHDLIFERFPEFYSAFDRKMHFWKFKKATQVADKIIAISEQTKRDVMEFLQVPEEKISVVYQGCHPSFKQKPTDDFLNSLRKKYQLPQRFLLNVGTIEERKNLLSVVRALSGTKIPLVAVGRKTAYFEKIQAEIRKNSVEVLFLEGLTMEELSGLYRLADVFIYPSLFEGFGIPIIESLFSECVVITSDTSCLPEAGGENSVYVSPFSVEDMREKIISLWENPEERRSRAEKGRLFVEQFTDEKIAQNLMKVYQEVLS